MHKCTGGDHRSVSQGNTVSILKNQHIFSLFFFGSLTLSNLEEGREQKSSSDQIVCPQCKFELKPSLQANGFIKLSRKHFTCNNDDFYISAPEIVFFLFIITE